MRLPDDPNPGGGPGGTGARRPTPPAFNVPPATLGLAALILVVFAALKVMPAAWTEQAVLGLSLIPSRLATALAGGNAMALVESGATLASYALVHLDWPHVLLNLGFLLAFGSGLERALGGLTLLVVFMLSAVAGAGLMLALDWGAPIVVIGASGGVSGLIGGVIRLLLTDPHEPARRRLGFTLLSVVVALDLVFGLLGAAALGMQGAIAWQTHLGGLLAGLLLVRRPRVDLSV